MSRYGVLVAKIENERCRLTQVAQAAQNQSEKAKRTGDADYLQAAALSLQNFYMGVERIFEEIAKQVDESLPTGSNSHQALLEQMSLAIPGARQPVLQLQSSPPKTIPVQELLSFSRLPGSGFVGGNFLGIRGGLPVHQGWGDNAPGRFDFIGSGK